MSWLVPVSYMAAACVKKSGFVPSIWDGMQCDANGAPAIGSIQDLLVIVANVVRILVALSGVMAVIFILVAGVYYIISAGDAGRTKQAKDILNNLVVGLVIIIGAYALLTFIAQAF